MNIENACREVQQKGPGTYRIRYQDGKTETKRLFSNPGTFFLCEMLPRKRKKGKIINPSLISTMTAIEKMPEKKSASRNEPSFAAFLRNLHKAEACLSASGLWPGQLACVKALLSHTEEELREFYDFVNTPDYSMDGFSAWYESVNKKALALGAGALSVDELVNISRPSGIKRIPYPGGERDAERMRLYIEAVVREHTPTSVMPVEQSYSGISWRGPRFDHDVRVRWENEAKEVRGWYDEEYHGCGNGYYFLLLDHHYAMFMEKD